MHLALNTISILVIGSGLENGLGWWKLFCLYFVSSFGGILFSSVINPLTYSVGASTAIFGLIGYYVSTIHPNAFNSYFNLLDCLFVY